MIIIPATLLMIPLFGALLVSRVPFNKRLTSILLTFSGAYLLSLVFLHILPEIYYQDFYSIGLFILGGFLLQVLLDYFSKGLEHGHVHAQNKSPISGILIGLFLHSFIESIPLGMGHFHHFDENQSLLYGIALHKLPVSIVLAALLFNRYQHSIKAWGMMVLFGLSGLLGYAWGLAMGSAFEIPFKPILAFVVGILLHVGTTIIFESSDSHRINVEKLIALILGFALSAFLMGT